MNILRLLNERQCLNLLYAIFAALVMASQPSNAQSVSAPYQLNADQQVFGDVVGAQLSPDGKYLVYASDQVTNGQIEIFSVPISGGNVTRLNSPFTLAGTSVGMFRISPDSQRVVYRADSLEDNVLELFSVPIGGGSSVRLNANFPTGGDVSNYAISSDSRRVVYLADQIVNERQELFSVAIEGGSVQRLNSQLPTGGEVTEFQISSDSTRVLYIADQNFLGINQLFSARIIIGTNSQIQGSDQVEDFKITPDSNSVVFKRPNGAGGVRLWRAAISGGASVNLVTGAPVFSVVASYEISPDSSRVVYLADQNVGGVFELFSVSINAGARTRLNEDLAVNGEEFVGDVGEGFKISADSQGVIYLADQNVNNVRELFYVAIDGGSVTRLNADLPVDADVLEESFKFTPNNERVVYQAEQRFNNVTEIFSVAVSGETPVRLNGDLPAAGDGLGFGFQIAPDSSFVVYRAQQNTAEVDELYLAPITGGASTRLNSDLPAGADVSSFYMISSDSSHIIYRADQDVFDEIELFGVAILEEEEEICFPIKASSAKVAVICL